MKQWQLEYWSIGTGKSPVERWLDKLTDQQFKSVAKELAMLEEVGNQLKLPHSRALGKGLFELRERRHGYRVYYTFYETCVIILLAAGDKKSQEHDIETARNRLSRLKEE